MSYKVLARKWRPHTFQDMVGQSHVLQTLTNALNRNQFHHAYLFSGTRGIGKTTLARIMAKCLNCEKGVSAAPCGCCSTCQQIDNGSYIDLIEVDAASKSKVEETRELMENVQYGTSVGRYKIYLIDEVHMFSNHSFNALLKTLEEPPNHVKFLLATTEPKKLPITILSRCLQFNLKQLTEAQIAEQLVKILAAEDIPYDPLCENLIAHAAYGSMRDALSLLDQAIAYGNGALQTKELHTMLGTVEHEDIIELLLSVCAGNGETLLQKIEKIAEQHPDYHSLIGKISEVLQQVAIAQTVTNKDTTEQISQLSEKLSPEEVQLYYQITLHGRRDLPYASEEKLGFQMMMIRMLAFQPESPKDLQHTKEISNQSIDTTNDNLPTTGSWQQAIEQMQLTGLIAELARQCVLDRIEENQLYLLLAEANKNLLTPKRRQRLIDAIHQHFGKQLIVTIDIGESDKITPNEQKQQVVFEQQQAAIQAMQKDPNVQSLIAEFDGKIDTESIHPV